MEEKNILNDFSYWFMSSILPSVEFSDLFIYE